MGVGGNTHTPQACSWCIHPTQGDGGSEGPHRKNSHSAHREVGAPSFPWPKERPRLGSGDADWRSSVGVPIPIRHRTHSPHTRRKQESPGYLPAPIFVEPPPQRVLYREAEPIYVLPEPIYVEPRPIFVKADAEPIYVQSEPVRTQPEPIYVESRSRNVRGPPKKFAKKPANRKDSKIDPAEKNSLGFYR